VVTPVVQFMSEILSTARPNSRAALAAGLYISSIMIEVSKVRSVMEGQVRLDKVCKVRLNKVRLNKVRLV
jgi:hypothetical protein